MDLIRELNDEVEQSVLELNEAVIAFNENCLFLNYDGADLCETAINFLTKLSNDIDEQKLTESEIANKMSALSVLSLFKKPQDYSNIVAESSSIRSYMKLDESIDGLDESQAIWLEALGKLKSEHNENGLSLKKHYIELLENNPSTLSSVIAELKSDYKNIRNKI